MFMQIKNVIDLTQTITNDMLVSSYDEPVKVQQIRNLKQNHYTDYQLTSGMHIGTHIDGPAHLLQTNEKIVSVFVDKFIGQGALIDARAKKIDKQLLNGVQLNQESIVLILTGQDKKFGTKEYFDGYSEVGLDFAQELVNKKIKMLGIDFWSPDKFPFPVHKMLLSNEILICENLTNLDKLVGIKDFTVIALPLKIEADSALSRVVALSYS